MVGRSEGIRSGIRMSHHEIQLWQLCMKGDMRGLSGADSSIKIGDDFYGTHSKGTTEQHCSWLGGMAEHRMSKVSCHIYKMYKMGFMSPLNQTNTAFLMYMLWIHWWCSPLFTVERIEMALYDFVGKQVEKKTPWLCWCKLFLPQLDQWKVTVTMLEDFPFLSK